MNQSLYGLRGIVTDSLTGKPIKAKIEILGHDTDSLHVYSNLPIEIIIDTLIQANYDVTISKNGYYTKTINTTILNNMATVENIKLVPENINPTSINEKSRNNIVKQFYDMLGKNVKKTSAHPTLYKMKRELLKNKY